MASESADLKKSIITRISDYGGLIMFSHTIFSLPFGLISMIFAAGGIPKPEKFAYILIALIGARNGANAFNRIADRRFDAKNPRTAGRHMPSGRVKLIEAYAVTLFFFAMLIFAAFMLNIVCVILLPFAIFIFVFYSYAKRFTWLCHLILGIACGGAPMGAWIAIRGTELTLTPFIMSAAVMFWVSGFDVIYATQDIEFDRKERLHSIPARFGLERALLIAKMFHLCAVLLFIALYFFQGLGIIYLVGIAIIFALLLLEHKVVSPGNILKMKLASYNINQIIGFVFLIFTLVDYFTGVRLW